LIDGFPRNEDNVNGWIKVMGGDVDLKFVLFLDCSEDTMIARITKRGEESGENKRNDDNLDVLQKRFGVFRE
jgi:UMP-CMP kinase